MEPTVTLSLAAFDKMRDNMRALSAENQSQLASIESTKEKTAFAHRQLGMLLSSLSALPEFQREVDTFNVRSEEAIIIVKDGQVTITIKETTTKKT